MKIGTKWARVKTWVAVKVFPFVARNAPDSVNAFIQERAGEMATQITLGYLAREGILTCFMCPRRAPLRKMGSVYACPGHVAAAQNKGQGAAVKKAVDKLVRTAQ